MHILINKQTGETISSMSEPVDCWQVRDGIAEWQEVMPTLDEQREILRAKINTERNRREMGGFTYLSKTFDSDQTSVTRINAAVNTAVAAILTSSVFSVEWTCKDNSTITLDAQQFLGLASALAQHSNAQHVRGRGLKDQAEAAQSEADLAVVENLLNEWKAEA
jgi:hypothetical protein